MTRDISNSTTTVVTTTDGTTTKTPGFNKHKRDLARFFLLLVTISLFLGYDLVATTLSMISILTLKDGKFWSVKNMKWMILSVTSCVTSIFTWQMQNASMKVELEKDYSLKLYIIAQLTRIIWASFLGFLLVSASHSKNMLT